MGIEITEDQWQALLVASGNRAGAVEAKAIELGVIQAPEKPDPFADKSVDKGVMTTYRDEPPPPNVMVEGADAVVEEKDDGE